MVNAGAGPAGPVGHAPDGLAPASVRSRSAAADRLSGGGSPEPFGVTSRGVLTKGREV